MPTLIVDNGFESKLDVGKIKPLLALNEKTITAKVRKSLRDRYELEVVVHVSCDADIRHGTWEGRCEIGGSQFRYRVLPENKGAGAARIGRR